MHQERQRGADNVRRILLIAILLNLSGGHLLQLRHWHVAIFAFLRRRDIFNVVFGKHGRAVSVTINHRQITAVADNLRLGFEHGVAVIVFNLGDEVRIHQITAVGQHRVTAYQLHWGERSRAQCQ
ncbi:hypothetical protein D3C81_1115190 [compost metagenome]